jgi:Icc-related predicted phosphoesterase
MIAFIGDVHGKFRELSELFYRHEALLEADAVVQVGDFGLWPRISCEYIPPPRMIYWIDGNHEYFPEIRGIQEPREVRANAVYVPRGTLLEAGGVSIVCMGGAESPDRARRREGSTWFPDESITVSDLARVSPDLVPQILASHAPPAFVVEMILGEPASPSARLVESLWERLRRPLCVSGHMHQRWRAPGIEVLGELDVLIVDPGSLGRLRTTGAG